jgi:NAD(P)-dependent dehydrogenase (short-subunit alcohol dehydrogenase family)
MPGLMDGKVALVTGAASGIGRASAQAFAAEGARVVAADVNEAGGEETVHLIRQARGEAVFVRADVSRAVDVEALICRTLDQYGRLDCAHNNAGVEGALAATADCTEENWDQVLNTNLKGIWLCMKLEIPAMLRQGEGAIVNASSVDGLVASRRGLPAYVASKHGVVGLTRAAALEYASFGIRVNAVCPGGIDTPMQERIAGGDPHVLALVAAAHPVGRMGTAEEVAAAVVWLCSDASRFVTGHALVLDGGLTAQYGDFD